MTVPGSEYRVMNIRAKCITSEPAAAAAAAGLALPARTRHGRTESRRAGCAGYAAAHPDGPASVTGMSQDPVAVAASNNPELTTLTAALSGQLNPK